MAKSRSNQAVKIAADAVFTADGQAKPALQSALQKAVESQRPVVQANLRRLRRKFPHASPAELSLKLDREFINTVTGSGAAIGATAIIPGIGTIASLGISAAATVIFMEATALYALSIAELHGVHLQDPERARTAVMAIMLGEEGTALMQSFAGHALGRGASTVSAWGSALTKNVPASAMKMVGNRIQKMFIKRMVLNQGSAMLGRLVPFGIGAVIGGAGNLMMGRSVVRATKIAFGPPPLVLTGNLALPPGPRPSLTGPLKAITAKLPGRKRLTMSELRVDLNSDLGESFGSWPMGDDDALLAMVTSANVACGFHAGDPIMMLRTARTAIERSVAVGAHPAYRDLAGFGRRTMDVSAEELYGDVLYQLSALDGILRSVGGELAYVKPHGALYNRIVVDAIQAQAVASAVRDFRQSLPILGLPGSQIESVCLAADVPFFREAFVDRVYMPDGSLVPRNQPGAVLHDVPAIADRAVRLVADGVVEAIDGSLVQLQPDSLCVHGDTPGAVTMAESVRAALESAGVQLVRFN